MGIRMIFLWLAFAPSYVSGVDNSAKTTDIIRIGPAMIEERQVSTKEQHVLKSFLAIIQSVKGNSAPSRELLNGIARQLMQTAELITDVPGRHYLTSKADALSRNQLESGDESWVTMVNNESDIVIRKWSDHSNPNQRWQLLVFARDKAAEAECNSLVPLLSEALGASLAISGESGLGIEIPRVSWKWADLYDALPGGIPFLIYPDDVQVRRTHGFSIIIYRNVIRQYFYKVLQPTGYKSLAKVEADGLDVSSIFAIQLLHLLAHFQGSPYNLSRTDSLELLDSSLKDLFLPAEELKANLLTAHVICHLAKSRKLTTFTQRRWLSTLVASWVSILTLDAETNEKKVARLLLNHYIEQNALVYDVIQGKLRLDEIAFAHASQRLIKTYIPALAKGDYERIKNIFDDSFKPGKILSDLLPRYPYFHLPFSFSPPHLD